MQADSLPAELQAKPKNTGVGTLSLLQRIFLSQESNRGLLHCRRILYQLNYQHLWEMTFEQCWDKVGVGQRKEKMRFLYQLLIVSVMQDIQQFIAPPVPHAAVLFPAGSAGKESTCNTGDLGSISGSGRSAGEGIGYPLQHS